MSTRLAACAVMFAASCCAAQAADFEYVGIDAVKKMPVAAVPLPQGAPASYGASSGAVTDENASTRLALCARNKILGYPRTQEEYGAFYAHFSALLAQAGLKISSASFDPQAGSLLSYDSPNGVALRRFLADELARVGDATAMAEAAAALERSGLPVAADYDFKAGGLNTYLIYYFTKSAEPEERENQLRILKTDGDPIDYELLGPVAAVSKPAPWLLAHIGPEIGYVSAPGKDAEDVERRLQSRKDFLVGQGSRIIGARIVPLNWPDLPEYRFAYEIYFYR